MKFTYQDIVASKVPVIMGIVNVTPDSFSDGGKFTSIDAAIQHSIKLIEDGADIIDIGGESTRPGADVVSEEAEFNRVSSLITELIRLYPALTISIDTTKSAVAEKCLNLGARIINDISGGTFDENMLNIAAKYDLPIIIMHIKGSPKNMQNSPSYENVIDEINNYFEERIKKAKQIGISKIILDPGIGFGKRIEDNYNILENLNKLKRWEYPLLMGVSKKSFLGKSLNLDIDDRENSTIIAETLSVVNGANIIRTHNVKNAVELKRIISFTNQNQNEINV